MASIRRRGSPTSSRASPAIPHIGLRSCCPGTGGHSFWPWRRSRPDPMHVNKVSRVRTIDRVAKDLGEDVDYLFDVAIEMEPEDGLIWVRPDGVKRAKMVVVIDPSEGKPFPRSQ